MNDFVIGMIVGGGIAAMLHYVNTQIYLYRIKRAEIEAVKVIVAASVMKGEK
jgi:hypothetical protein